MNLSADILLDRIKLKNKLNIWKFISLISFLILCLFSIKPFIKSKNKKQDYIAKISIEGIITEDKKRDKILNDIYKNDNIKAVLMYINSQGGTVTGSEDIFNNIREISTKKPVVALMGSIAASGGYMSAIASDYIIAHQSTITGSIGVIMYAFEVSELAKKVGVNVLTYKTGKYKAVPSPFELPTEEINKQIYSTLMDNYEIFCDMVSDRRKIEKPELLKLADGRIFTGRQAVSNKLIDAIGGEKDALNWLKVTKNIDTDSLTISEIKLVEEDNIIEKYFPKLGIFDNIKLSQDNLKGVLALWNP